MGFADRVRAWFRGEGKSAAPSPSTDKATRAAARELEEFVRTRSGVEGFLEPKTTIYAITLLLVAGDGEYLRRPVGGRDKARDLCTRLGIPLYDAARVGYPKRMRDWDRGIRRDEVSLEDLPPWPGEDEERPGDDA
ncbi:MAG: hypothetical protein R3249_04950 [Nitriliruptorales bacterium]|nr:hypothetical protein [Nitriliruptorales bacterium]